MNHIEHCNLPHQILKFDKIISFKETQKKTVGKMSLVKYDNNINYTNL